MTDIISSISGYFSRSLILGTFLPVVVFILLGALFLAPFLPPDFGPLQYFRALDKEWQALALSFVAIVLSGLIYNLSIPVLRLYEGYPWRNSWIGSFLTRRHLARFDDAQHRVSAMRACRSLMEATDKEFRSHESWVREFFEHWKALGSPLTGTKLVDYPWLAVWESVQARNAEQSGEVPSGAATANNHAAATLTLSMLHEHWKQITSALISEYSRLRRDLQMNYPERRGLILPTRLGNVIRSFEYYPYREYRIDSIAMWPRLVAIIPKEYAVAVDDAKTTVDFMINCSLLSLVLAIAILIAGLVYPVSIISSTGFFTWIAYVAFFFFLYFFFYRLAINRVGAWGEMVKGAFDLYRSDLLQKLGYKHDAGTREKERELWGEISRQVIYGDRFDKNLLNYAEAAAASYPLVSSRPAKAKLEITKGVTRTEDARVRSFYVRVKNADPKVDESDVVLSDQLGDDLDYEWNSARIGERTVPVSGINPYTFKLGSLPRNSYVVLRYNGIRRRAKKMRLF